MITADRLQRFEPASLKYQAGLIQAAQLYQINTPARVCDWLANLAVESNRFKVVAENLNYTSEDRITEIFNRYMDVNRDKVMSPGEVIFVRSFIRQPERLANYVYANRMGNGGYETGDGFRNRGQSLIQLTGHDNILAYSLSVHGDDRVLRDPTMLQRDPDAALAAGWFVHRNGLNAYADRGDFKGYCGLLNAGNPKITAHAYDDGDRKDLDTRMDWRVRAQGIFK